MTLFTQLQLLTPYLLTFAIILSLMVTWTFVQLAWKKLFAADLQDEDVLADRRECSNCRCEGFCQNKKIKTEKT